MQIIISNPATMPQVWESAPITGLPVEVLKMIGDEIFEAHVAESMPRWEREYSCFQEQC